MNNIYYLLARLSRPATPHLDDPGAVGADETGRGLCLEDMLNLGHVLLRDTLGDGHDQGNFVLDGVDDGSRAERGRDVDHGRVGIDALLGLCDSIEYGEAKVLAATLLGCHAAHHVGAILDGLRLRVEKMVEGGEE